MEAKQGQKSQYPYILIELMSVAIPLQLVPIQLLNPTMLPNKETTLLQNAMNGNQSAFRQIVDQHQQHIVATIRGMLGNDVAVDDVAQETFIRFYRSMKNFQGKSSLKTYLTRIAINLSLNELKKRKRQQQIFRSSETITNYGDNMVKDEGKRNDIQEIVRKGIERLDDKFKSVLVLRMLQGYSTKETAEILDIPLGTVLSRLNTAQKKLKNIIGTSGR